MWPNDVCNATDDRCDVAEYESPQKDTKREGSLQGARMHDVGAGCRQGRVALDGEKVLATVQACAGLILLTASGTICPAYLLLVGTNQSRFTSRLQMENRVKPQSGC
ncbi:hypothetical protein PENSPDRAFT_650198 [Peniophora sp. CONT]|nr:hypothetical protein PENSPDRAFT_650198 [Peniophora sp. CONT]